MRYLDLGIGRLSPRDFLQLTMPIRKLGGEMLRKFANSRGDRGGSLTVTAWAFDGNDDDE